MYKLTKDQKIKSSPRQKAKVNMRLRRASWTKPRIFNQISKCQNVKMNQIQTLNQGIAYVKVLRKLRRCGLVVIKCCSSGLLSIF